MKRLIACFSLLALGACTSGSIPGVTVTTTPFDITLPLGANNAPLVLHCQVNPLSCSGSYVVDGQTFNVQYPAPVVSPSPSPSAALRSTQ